MTKRDPINSKVYLTESRRAWIVPVNMGYGHQRTAYPLKDFAFGGKFINANDYEGMPQKDRKIWERARIFYEFISRFKRIPLIGNLAFSIFDKLQEILSYYPERDQSKPNIQLKQIYSFIKKGWGRDLILRLTSGQTGDPLPIVTTFFTPAFMAEFFNYPGQIFCIVCDADISRTWAPLNPKSSKIKYFAPTERVVKRLEQYGIKKENIFLTGYPLPQELVGGGSMEILKEDLRNRILNLDPKKKYCKKYCDLIEMRLGKLPEKSNHPLTLMFTVGGAGAQKEIGIRIIRSLAAKIRAEEIKVILVAGTRRRVKKYFEENLERLKLKDHQNVEIVFGEDIKSYFNQFNLVLRKTDILWTKPSELSFYSALGLPIIIAPPIGSQEEFNKRWLLKSGFGNSQKNPRYTHQWLFDWLERGYLAEAAMHGFIKGQKLGALNIGKIIFKNG